MRAVGLGRWRASVRLIAVAAAISFAGLLRSAAADDGPTAGFEAAVLNEINAARADPAGYAQKLRRYRSYFHGRQVNEPGHPTAMTNEGVAAVDDAIAYLARQSPLAPLTPTEALSASSRRLADDLSASAEISHTDAQGATLRERVQAAGVWAGLMEEDISTAQTTPEDVVRQLVVDDGVPSRGHRTAIFSATLKIDGAACGSSAAFKRLCVVDFAGAVMRGPGSETEAANTPPPQQPPGQSTVERIDRPPVGVTPPPSEPQAVCGPDITDKVFATLAAIKKRYEDATPAQRDEACGSLYGWSYNSAWDIDGLDPDSAPDANTSWNGATGGWTKTDPRTHAARPFSPWFTGRSKVCAIPRPDDVCAATVEFQGTCQHAQVVNYVMWGAVNKLCGYSDWRANAAVALRSFFKDDELRDSQRQMTAIGYQAYSKPESTMTLYNHRTWVTATQPKKYAQCSLTCKVSIPPKPPFNFLWSPL